MENRNMRTNICGSAGPDLIAVRPKPEKIRANGHGRIWFSRPFDKEEKEWIRDILRPVVERQCPYNEDGKGSIYLEQTAAFSHSDLEVIDALNGICERFDYECGDLRLSLPGDDTRTWRLIGKTRTTADGSEATLFCREDGQMVWKEVPAWQASME